MSQSFSFYLKWDILNKDALSRKRIGKVMWDEVALVGTSADVMCDYSKEVQIARKCTRQRKRAKSWLENVISRLQPEDGFVAWIVRTQDGRISPWAGLNCIFRGFIWEFSNDSSIVMSWEHRSVSRTAEKLKQTSELLMSPQEGATIGVKGCYCCLG
jgi:hypothetical protein